MPAALPLRAALEGPCLVVLVAGHVHVGGVGADPAEAVLLAALDLGSALPLAHGRRVSRGLQLPAALPLRAALEGPCLVVLVAGHVDVGGVGADPAEAVLVTTLSLRTGLPLSCLLRRRRVGTPGAARLAVPRESACRSEDQCGARARTSCDE